MDLRDLYEEVILEHNRNPRNYDRKPPEANCTAHGYNPLCGDEVHVHLSVKDGVIEDASFEGAGCAISTASASMMTEAVQGMRESEAEQLFDRLHHLLTEGDGEPPEDIGKLAVLSGVRDFPMRVKCATLAWHTLQAALKRIDEPVSTE